MQYVYELTKMKRKKRTNALPVSLDQQPLKVIETELGIRIECSGRICLLTTKIYVQNGEKQEQVFN